MFFVLVWLPENVGALRKLASPYNEAGVVSHTR